MKPLNDGYERHVLGEYDMWCSRCQAATPKWRCVCGGPTIHYSLLVKDAEREKANRLRLKVLRD